MGRGVGRSSQHTVVVALPGCNVQGCVPVVVDSVEVAAGIQEDLGDGSAASEGGPVQTDVFLLQRWWQREWPGQWALASSLHCVQGLGQPHLPHPNQTLTLSVRVTSAPRVSSMRITSMCLCSAAQMMGVHPPLSYGWEGSEESGGQAQHPAPLAEAARGREHTLWSQTQLEAWPATHCSGALSESPNVSAPGPSSLK